MARRKDFFKPGQNRFGTRQPLVDVNVVDEGQAITTGGEPNHQYEKGWQNTVDDTAFAAASINKFDYDNTNIASIPIERIRPNPFQARKHFKQLEELAQSIKVQGFQSVLLARLDPDPSAPKGTVQIVYGERRLRAAKMAGLTEIPCRIKELTDTQMREIGLIENLQRENLETLEEAEAYWQLNRFNNYSIEFMADRLSKSESYIRYRVALHDSPEDVKELVAENDKAITAAVTIARLSDAEERQPLIRDYKNGVLNADQVRKKVMYLLSKKEKEKEAEGQQKQPINSSPPLPASQQAVPVINFMPGMARPEPTQNTKAEYQAPVFGGILIGDEDYDADGDSETNTANYPASSYVPRPNYNAEFHRVRGIIRNWNEYLKSRPEDATAVRGYAMSLIEELQRFLTA